MRVLLDTNIIIDREDSKEISANLQRLTRLLNEVKILVLVHPRSIPELERNKDPAHKQIILSKILAYTPLEFPPDPSIDPLFLSRLKPSTRINDYVDNIILYALYRNAVNFLITEDHGIHSKAKLLNIDNRVFSIVDAISFFEQYSQKHNVISPPALKPAVVHSLDLNDPFFDSLKDNYPEFENNWFPKICQEGRKCFVNYQNGQIGALLIYNIEDNDGISDSLPPLPISRRLKLCTFKVSHNGQKIGELFVKLAIQIALKNDISEIYLTLFSKDNDRLIELITEFGFFSYGKKINGESIYLKKLRGNQFDVAALCPLEFNKIFYPSFYDGPDVKKFIIPIQPEFHVRLFTDYPKRQSGLFEHNGDFYSEGNSIKKAYITRTKSKNIHPGDILLFYRSVKDQAITTLGVVDEFHTGISDNETIIGLVAKRTVYSQEELEIKEKPVSVILFKFHFHFPNPIDFKELIREKLIKAAPQSISKLENENYQRIKEIGGFDERFAFD